MPITATRLPVRSTSWFQRAEWKISPWKVSMPSIVGQPRLRQAAGAADRGRRGRTVPLGGLARSSAGASSSQAASSTAVSKTNRSRVPDSLGDLLDVGLDLRLRGEGHRPVGVGREGEGVELARHVAGRAGVGVVAPGAADVGALLDDDEVALAVLLQLDRGAQTGEPGADDQVLDGPVGVRRLGRCSCASTRIGVIEQVSIECGP